VVGGDGDECSERALDASKASVSDDYIHTYYARPVGWQQDCAGRQISRKRDGQIKAAERSKKLKEGKMRDEE